MNESIVQLGGRLHPLLLHLPLGVIAVLVFIEFWFIARRRPMDRGVRLLLVWFLALSAGVSVGSGLLLSREDSYVGDTVDLHRWLGIAAGSFVLISAILATIKRTRVYAAVLVLAVGVIIPAGHIGGTMTHGENFLTEPFMLASDETARADQPDPTRSWYEAEIAPIFEANCTNCHGGTRRKSGLSLHTSEAIADGSKHGSILSADEFGDIPLAYRIALPVDDDDHMPPEGKPQLTAAQIDTIVRWVEAGAPFDAPSPQAASSTEHVEEPEVAETAPARLPLSPDAVAALRAAHVHVEMFDPESELLWIDMSATPDMYVADAVRLLSPLAPNVAELSLRGVSHANEILASCGPWDQLANLDLSYAGVGVEGLSALAQAGQLTDLSLIGSELTEEAAALLASLESIQKLHVWGSNLSEETIVQLSKQLPALVVNLGEADAPEPVETEPKVTLGAPPPVATVSLNPVNTVCPVSGSPIDPRYAVVHEGRVIAFCCENCPGQFWTEPDKFPVKIADTGD